MRERERGKTPGQSVWSWRGICLLSVDLIKSDSLVSPPVGGRVGGDGWFGANGEKVRRWNEMKLERTK